MTPFQTVYDAFLSRILDDEWQYWMEEEAQSDWHQILINALSWFKFPRTSLEYNDDGFLATLDNEEIQILADFMKCEWLNRCIMTWENVKPLYEERDFSQANLLDKLNALYKAQEEKARLREAVYYRSRKGKPFDFTQLAGGSV